LVPNENSKVWHTLSYAITETIPSILPEHKPVDFFPHVTITSEILPSTVGDDPQVWLDNLELKHCEDVRIRFQKLVTEDKFFKRLFIRCEKDPGLFCVAKACRKWAVEGGDHSKAGKWLNGNYDPHCSLM
jgi:2',3'-cyclic-nucleotide 3'-phosphodiesterase